MDRHHELSPQAAQLVSELLRHVMHGFLSVIRTFASHLTLLCVFEGKISDWLHGGAGTWHLNIEGASVGAAGEGASPGSHCRASPSHDGTLNDETLS